MYSILPTQNKSPELFVAVGGFGQGLIKYFYYKIMLHIIPLYDNIGIFLAAVKNVRAPKGIQWATVVVTARTTVVVETRPSSATAAMSTTEPVAPSRATRITVSQSPHDSPDSPVGPSVRSFSEQTPRPTRAASATGRERGRRSASNASGPRYSERSNVGRFIL